MTLDHFEEPKRARMTFQLKGIRSPFRVEGVGKSQLEPIKNPITVKDHQVVVELSAGCFESARMDMASSKVLVVDDGILASSMKEPMEAFKIFHVRKQDHKCK